MENSNSDITIVQPNYDSIYSSVVTISQQPIENPVPNNNNNVVVIIVDDNDNQTTNYESVNQSEPIQSNDSSSSNKNNNCIVIHGDIIKEKNKWWLIDSSNNDLYETGKLDKNGNRSGLSYVCLNGETREIHSYNEDERIGNYLCFCDGLMYEYDEEDILLYEGHYGQNHFGDYVRCGIGKEYEDGKLYYDGEWENDLPNGDGILYNDDGTIFKEGKWDNGYIRYSGNYIFWKTKTVINDKLIGFLYASLSIMIVVFIPIILFTFNLDVISCHILSYIIIFIYIYFLSKSSCCSTFMSFVLGIGLIFYFLNIASLLLENVNSVMFTLIVVFHFYPLVAALLLYFIRNSKPYPSDY